MDDFLKFLNARQDAYHTNPKRIDEVIYTPYVYQPSSYLSSSSTEPSRTGAAKPVSRTGDLLGIPELVSSTDHTTPAAEKKKSKFDAPAAGAEIFLFEYGTVVIWGMSGAFVRLMSRTN